MAKNTWSGDLIACSILGVHICLDLYPMSRLVPNNKPSDAIRQSVGFLFGRAGGK